MKRQELVEMLDPNEFNRLIDEAKIPESAKQSIIRDRAKWLWETYKPADMDWHRERYGR